MVAAHLGFQSGTTFIYQGQELAQKNMPREWGMEHRRDIECINHWKTVLRDHPDNKEVQQKYLDQYWLIGRDNARTPMQWTDGKWAGFMPADTKEGVEPWMDIHPDYKEWNAKTALADKDSAYYYWQSVLKLTKEHKDIFVYGEFTMLDFDDEYVIAYTRSAVGAAAYEKTALIVTNFGGEEQGKSGYWWKIPKAYEKLLVKDGALNESAIISALQNYRDDNEIKVENGGSWINLRPYEAIVALV